MTASADAVSHRHDARLPACSSLVVMLEDGGREPAPQRFHFQGDVGGLVCFPSQPASGGIQIRKPPEPEENVLGLCHVMFIGQ